MKTLKAKILKNWVPLLAIAIVVILAYTYILPMFMGTTEDEYNIFPSYGAEEPLVFSASEFDQVALADYDENELVIVYGAVSEVIYDDSGLGNYLLELEGSTQKFSIIPEEMGCPSNAPAVDEDINIRLVIDYDMATAYRVLGWSAT